MENLNEMELAVYRECKIEADSNGDEYQFVFEFLVDKSKLKLSNRQFKGYIGQLVQKGYLITLNDKKNPCYHTHAIVEYIPIDSLKYYSKFFKNNY